MRDFNHTVNVLVKAFLNDTLEHENCAACAVGNIICASGINLKDGFEANAWFYTICSLIRKDSQRAAFTTPTKQRTGLAQMAATGYTIKELNLIELAFESEPEYIESGVNEDRMFNGLMKVVDVLADIHGISLESKEEAKLLFVKI